MPCNAQTRAKLPPSPLVCAQLEEDTAFSEGTLHCWLEDCSAKAKKSQVRSQLIYWQLTDEAEHKQFASLKLLDSPRSSPSLKSCQKPVSSPHASSMA